MKKKNNDVLNFELSDDSNGYYPSIDLSDYRVEKFLREFKITDDLTTITATRRAWISFMVILTSGRYLKSNIEEEDQIFGEFFQDPPMGDILGEEISMGD